MLEFTGDYEKCNACGYVWDFMETHCPECGSQKKNKTTQLGIGAVKHCTFCKKKITNKEDTTYTEDAEIAHSKCLKAFEKHWNDRDETFDLIGY